jgi:hypothetical protein
MIGQWKKAQGRDPIRARERPNRRQPFIQIPEADGLILRPVVINIIIIIIIIIITVTTIITTLTPSPRCFFRENLYTYPGHGYCRSRGP